MREKTGTQTATGGRRITPEARAQRETEYQERKASMAQERESVVVFARTLDSRVLIEIQRNLDRNLRFARLRIGIDPDFTAETVFPIIEGVYAAFRTLDDFNRQLSKLSGKPHRSPKMFRNAKPRANGNGAGKGAGKSAVAEASVENALAAQDAASPEPETAG
jgi:hypothetical protein